MTRIKVLSASPYEEEIGFSRASRIGDMIAIAGTAPIAEDGSTAYQGDAYKQTRRCLKIIEQALIECGSSLNDIIRTRIYVTDISKWQEIGRAHGGFFRKIKPTSTMLEVSKLVRDDWFVEIEADAVIEVEDD